MVGSATNFSRSGLRDWIIQRISAIILGIYFITLIIFFLSHLGLNYEDWESFFYNPFMQIFNFLVLLSLIAHAWIGVWTIFTDYIKPKSVRLFFEAIMGLALLSYLAWGISIIWR